MHAKSPAQAGLFVCVLHGKAAMHLEERRQPRSWHQWNRRCRCNQLDHLLRGLCRSYKMDALPGKPLPSMARHYSPLPFAQRRGGLGRGRLLLVTPLPSMARHYASSGQAESMAGSCPTRLQARVEMPSFKAIRNNGATLRSTRAATTDCNC